MVSMDSIVFIRQIVDPQVRARGIDYFDFSQFSEDDLIINPFDKFAIEAVLKIKDQTQGSVTAICIEAVNPKKALREAVAMGCDKAIAISLDKKYLEGSYDFSFLAHIYLKVLEKVEKYDIISIGGEVISTGFNAITTMLGELLDLPTVTYVEKIELQSDKLHISRIIEGGSEILESSYPLVLSFADSDFLIPRLTPMRGILKARTTPIEVYTLEDLEIEESDTSLHSNIKKESFENIEVVRNAYILKDDEPEKMVDALLAKLKEDGVNLYQ